MVNQLSFFFLSFRASPHGWICGVVSTKTPSSIVLCLEKIALSKECNRMVKYQNGKVYKLLTKIRASLSVLCHLTSLLWSWRWANSSWNDCVGKNHVCRIENLHIMTVLTLFKQWWDKSAVEIEQNLYLDNDAVLMQRPWICSNNMLWYSFTGKLLTTGCRVALDLRIGHLQDDIILLLLPESFSFFLSYLNFVIPVRFK